MGDLAEEIEQMQAEINAFDDKLDALDANGEEGRKEEEPVKKSIFSRLGSSGDVVRKSSTGEDNQSEEGEEDDTTQAKRRKSSVKSAVIDTKRRRESEISKEDINKAQLGNEAGKRRASRMFKNLLGTLRTFDENTKSESVSSKRAEIDRKVEERVAADRRKIIEEKRLLLIKKREKEKLLELLQAKKDFAELRVGWEDHAMEQAKYIRTLAKPQLYWKPRIMEAGAKELLKKSKDKVIDLLEESKVEWDRQRAEMTTEINEIKERHQFKDIDLRVDSDVKRPTMAHRLVITKSLKNDSRIVQPKSSNGRIERTIEPVTPTTPTDENGMRKVNKEDRKQKEKERRKEIENARKRRHKSDSDSEDEYEERPRKLVGKKDKIEDVKIVKDVRRVAPKEDPPKPDTNILPSTTRRISLKTTKKPEIEHKEDEPKRRKIAKKSESHHTSSDKRQSSDSSSSSSSSSESDSCNRTPSKSG